MPYCRESQLRERADEPTLKIFDFWHSLCIKKLGKKLEIVANNSKEHPKYGKISGGFASLALPLYRDDKIVAYCLWIDGFPNVENILITHELCHPILRFMGYKYARQNNDPNSFTEIFLNSLCDHPVLYKFQKSFGQNPQNMIDNRAKNHLRFVSKSYRRHPKDELLDSLLLADDVYNSSKNILNLILRKSKRFHANIYVIIDKIISIMKRYNLVIAVNNLICRFELIDALNLKGDWIIHDDIDIVLQNI